MALEHADGADRERFVAVLKESITLLDEAGVPNLGMGGIASTVLGRARWTHDIDLFVPPGRGGAALDALAAGGFETERTNERWLYKAAKDDVPVDIIFRSHGGITLDETMLARAVEGTFEGQTLKVVPPEDMLVIKALNHDEETPHDWHDALGLLAVNDLDWPYLLDRARFGPRRVLSLLIYAESADLLVSREVIRSLYDLVYGQGSVAS